MSEKFTLMHAEKANHTIGLMARLLEVSRAGYYAWAKRQGTLSPTAARRTWLAEQIRTIHAESNGVNGFRRVLAGCDAPPIGFETEVFDRDSLGCLASLSDAMQLRVRVLKFRQELLNPCRPSLCDGREDVGPRCPVRG